MNRCCILETCWSYKSSWPHTLAIVVGSEDNGDVLDERDESECPEDKGEDAEDLLVGVRVLDILGEGALEDVQGGYAQVSIDHS